MQYVLYVMFIFIFMVYFTFSLFIYGYFGWACIYFAIDSLMALAGVAAVYVGCGRVACDVVFGYGCRRYLRSKLTFCQEPYEIEGARQCHRHTHDGVIGVTAAINAHTAHGVAGTCNAACIRRCVRH